MTKKLSLKQNMFYNSIGSIVYLGCQWLLSILVVKLSGYKDAGIISLSMSVASAIYAISAFGMRNYQSSDINNKYSNDSYVFSRIFTSLIGIVMCLIFVLLNDYNAYTKGCIFIYMIFKTSEAFVDVFNGAEQKKWRMDVCGISLIIRGIFSIIIFALVLYFSHNLLLALLLMAVGVYILIFIYDVPKYLKIVGFNRKFDYIQIKNLLLSCLPLALYGLIGNVILFFPKYYLEVTFSEELLGIYSSLATPVLIIQVAASFIFNPLITLISEVYNEKNKKQFYSIFVKVFLCILIIGVLGLAAIYFLGDFGLQLLFNEELLAYKNLLYPILIVTLLTSFVWFISMLLTVIREFKVLMLGSMLSLMISIISSVLIIPNKGLNGVNDCLIVANIAELFIWILLGVRTVNKYFNGGNMGVKNKLIKFCMKHKSLIIKFVPNFIVNKFAPKLLKNTNNFSRQTKFSIKFPIGINVVGYFKAQFGLGQGTRLLGQAVCSSKYDHSIIDVQLGDDIKYNDKQYDNKIKNEFIYNINLLHIMPYTGMEMFLTQYSIDNLKNKYNIGYWLFELENIPEEWYDSFKYVNEIWTPSNFVTEAFKKVSPVPVYTIPYPLNQRLETNQKLTRKDFKIPEDKFSYLVMFDSGSTSERKNPGAVIDAFINAFPNNDDVCLVIKINNAKPSHIETLKKKVEHIKSCIFINETLPKSDVNRLIELCDVFVSLHRSEGFGLVMAEAMNLGTVCIATNYSANTDFMNKNNSCLVDYKLIPVKSDGYFLYNGDNVWADPDINQASELSLIHI